MELKDYTTEELRAEIKRRRQLEQEEQKKALKCCNCVHCTHHPRYAHMYICNVRTCGRKK